MCVIIKVFLKVVSILNETIRLAFLKLEQARTEPSVLISVRRIHWKNRLNSLGKSECVLSSFTGADMETEVLLFPTVSE